MIAQGSLNEVLDRADIVDVVGQFVRLKKRGANYIANCPFHNEKTPSFSVSPSKGIFKCFGCGKGGNAVNFVMEHEKLTYVEGIRWLADHYKIELEETERSPEQVVQQKVEESLRVLNEYATVYFHETLLNSEEGQDIGLSYFRQRGIREAAVEKFRLGYSLEDSQAFHNAAGKAGYKQDLMLNAGLIKERNGSYYDAYRGRIIFPIQSMTGRVLGFGARILKSNDKAPKYVNSPENELYVKSRVLYGMFQARQAIAKQDECLLVEGYLDVVSLSQAGVENVVASSGTSLTEDQLRAIGQLSKNLTILYDGDTAGIKAALRGVDLALGQSFNVQLVLLPEGEDPDSYVQEHGKAGFESYLKQERQDIISFRMAVGLKEVGNDPVKKSKLVNEVAETIARIDKAEDFSLQQHYLKVAATKLEVEEAGLINLVNKYIRERLDTEKKHRERDAERSGKIPIEENATVHPEVLEGPQTTTVQESQEWQLIRVLLEYGAKQYDGSCNIAELIHNRIDPDLIESPTAKLIYQDYQNFVEKHGHVPEQNHFINNNNVAISQSVARVLHNKDEVSHNWKDVYGIESIAGEDNYINDVESTLSYFEYKKLKLMQAELTAEIMKEKDEGRLMKLMRKHLKLKQEEKEILQNGATVIMRMI